VERPQVGVRLELADGGVRRMERRGGAPLNSVAY
jgi:hypothetical protein